MKRKSKSKMMIMYLKFVFYSSCSKDTHILFNRIKGSLNRLTIIINEAYIHHHPVHSHISSSLPTSSRCFIAFLALFTSTLHSANFSSSTYLPPTSNNRYPRSLFTFKNAAIRDSISDRSTSSRSTASFWASRMEVSIVEGLVLGNVRMGRGRLNGI